MSKTKCSVHECTSDVVARGLCDLHYRRLLHHEDLEQGRPEDWGSRADHVLYSMWSTLRRRNIAVASEWRDFWIFVRDVGERPSKDHSVQPVDVNRPLGPSNFFWREKVVKKRKTESQKEYWARYQRAYRKLHPDRVRNTDLKKDYGINLDDYDRMLAEQGGVCAICKQPERAFEKRFDRVRKLAVDHCHDTGKVRGLLCTGCNQGIGNFDHNIELLRLAITYLWRFTHET